MEAAVRKKPSSAFERVFSGIFAAGMTFGTVLVIGFDPEHSNFFPICPLLNLTGIACPGCGLTRGFHALFHGDFVRALDYNAMIPIYAILLIILYVSLILTAVRGRGLNLERFPSWFGYLILAVALLFMVIRNLPFEPFRFLYP